MSQNPQADLSGARQDYVKGELSESHAPSDPLVLFDTWFKQALEAQVSEPYAFSLASSAKDTARPSVRTVLMRSYSNQGFSFYTNYLSRKGVDLSENPQCEALFFWPDLERQVRIYGEVQKLPQSQSAEYFAKRPKQSQLAAWVSDPQSAPVASRQVMSENYTALEQQYEQGEVPKPEWWGGYLIKPLEVEFWQGRRSRMHDRLVYRLDSNSTKWQQSRLLP